MKLELLSKEEIVENDECCTQQREQEGCVAALALCLIYIPESVSEHNAAEGDQIRVD